MKPFVTVSLLLHGNTEVEIADYVDNNGKFVNIGTQAAAAIDRGDNIHYVTAEGVDTFIPFHAIDAVNFAKESDDFTPAEDAFCEEDVTDYTYWTVTFYNGETALQSGLVKDGDTPVYSGATPTKEGYTFLGWNTDAEAEEPLETLPAITEATSLYAIFEEESSQAVVGTAIVGTDVVSEP